MRTVHEETVNSFAHAMPFAELIRCLDAPPTPGQHQIYDVRFALQNHPMPDAALPGISVKLQMRSTGTARFDLGCEVTEEGDTLEVVWLSRPHLFSHEEIQHLHSVFVTILSAGCKSPEISLAILLNEL
jgi:hypothetical protein